MKLKNLRICRICFKDLKNSTDYKKITDIDKDDNIQIITKIEHCSQIELNNPLKDLPLRICTKCYKHLRFSYKFCMICQDSERKFQKLQELNSSKDCGEDSEMKNPLDTEINFNENMYELEDIKLEILPPKEEVESIQTFDSDEELSNDLKNDTFPTTSNDDENNDDIKDFDFKLKSNTPKLSENSDSNEPLKPPERKKKYLKKPKVLEYRCEVCNEPFNTRSQMTSHMKSSHKQAYKCKDCNKAFDSNIARNKHERRAHTDPSLRPHKCDFCIRTFYRLDLLKKHYRVHTGEKPFVCEKCGIAFKQIHHLKNHLKSMTPCVLKMSIKIE